MTYREKVIEAVDVCKTCNGTGIMHVCSWVCVDMECLDCTPKQRAMHAALTKAMTEGT